MNRSAQVQNRFDQRLAKQGGSYILRLQSSTQFVSYFAAAIGVYYILVAANFDKIQTQLLLICVFVLIFIINLLLPIFTTMATVNSRTRLDILYKNKNNAQNISAEELEKLSWNEIIALPKRFAWVELATAYLIVVVPAILFTLFVCQATTIQVVHVVIGGVLSASGVVVQNVLFFDRGLAPVRRALLPSDSTHQEIKRNLKLQGRLLAVISLLIISAILMIGSLGYQKLLDSQNGSIDTGQFLTQAGIISGLLLASSIFLATQLTRSVSLPIQEMIHTIDDVLKGNFSLRSTIITSDETAYLTIQLNQLLYRLQNAQRDLEQKVEERTAELSRKALQLQASAQIARDTATQRDIGALLARTVGLVSDQFGFYHTGIFLVDDSGEFAILLAASSEGGKRMLERGHRLEIGQGIVGTTIRQNKSHVAIDVGTDVVYFNNPDLPNTRSEAAIPLSVMGKVIGVLDIQSTEPAAFTQDDIGVLQILADQIALAIQNARLIAESQNAFQRLDAVTSEDLRLSWRERIRDTKKAYRYTSVGLTALPAISPIKVPLELETNQLNIPIALRGQRIGNITFSRKSSTNWTEADRALAIEIANQVSLALENARLLEEAQRRAAQEQSLNNLTAQLSRSLDIDTLLQTALRELHQLPDVTETSVYVSTHTPSSSAGK